MNTEELYKLKSELTEKIRSEKDKKKREELIEQSRSVNSQLKLLKTNNTNNTINTTNVAVSDIKQSNKEMKECKGCHTTYEGSKSNKNFVDIVYCGACRKIRGKDIIELITVNNDGTECIEYFYEQNSAANKLMTLKADVRLDLHKTLDTLSIETKLPMESVCCISYVGNFTQTRINARTDIINRIKTKQIRFGLLVFKRGSKRDPDQCNRFHEVGSKAWANKYLDRDSDNVIFVDDSDDHVYSVKSIDNSINSIKLHDRLNLVSVLEKCSKGK